MSLGMIPSLLSFLTAARAGNTGGELKGDNNNYMYIIIIKFCESSYTYIVHVRIRKVPDI